MKDKSKYTIGLIITIMVMLTAISTVTYAHEFNNSINDFIDLEEIILKDQKKYNDSRWKEYCPMWE